MHTPPSGATMRLQADDGIFYPHADGKPLAESTKQLDWILLLTANLRALFASRADVFVAGDQLWYPVRGRPDICFAPDVYVVFGRPKGDRLSWKQWEENDTPLTVVFEILSHANTVFEMADKLEFYGDHGVEEYYVYDPDRNRLMVYLRGQILLRRERCTEDRFTSPRLGVRFDWSGPEMQVTYPDGRPFLTLDESEQARLQAEADLDLERQARQQVEAARDAERQARHEAERRLARITHLAQRVASGTATPEEAGEFQRLVAGGS